MGEERKGRVVLQTQPSVEIERDIVDLLRQVEEGVTARDLVSRLRAVPAVLRENVSASDGKEIAKFFKELGADAVFVAYDRQESGALKGSAAGKRVTTFTSWRIFGLYLLLLLALGLCLAVGAYYVEKKSAPAPRPQGAAALEMDSAFLAQYALKPDSRFLNAFQLLAQFYGDLAAPAARPRLGLGAPLLSEAKLILPLMVEGKEKSRISMALPLDFKGCMAALDAWYASLEAAAGQLPAPAATLDAGIMAKAAASIAMVDPRTVIAGLSLLDAGGKGQTPHPESLRLAVQGYSLLLFVLAADPMQYSDTFGANGLALLAMAKRLAPSAAFEREEVLLALAMGYKAHATTLLKNTAPPPPANAALAAPFDAYVRGDEAVLRSQATEAKQFLAPYLLERFLRERGQSTEAVKVVAPLFNRYPAAYPSMISLIHSSDLGTARVLSGLFYQDVFARLQAELSRDLESETWAKIAQSVNEDSLAKFDVSSLRFETLLAAWNPLPPGYGTGFFMDAERARTVFRSLYALALDMRFHILFNMLGMIDRSEEFGRAIAADGKGWPLGTSYLAQAQAELGKNAEADALCVKLLREASTPGIIANRVFFALRDPLKQTELVPVLAQHLDGRPFGEHTLGIAFAHQWNYDLAVEHYERSLAENPDNYQLYAALSNAQGSDASLVAGLEIFPTHIPLLWASVTYYDQRADKASLEKLLGICDRILQLPCERATVIRKKASALRRLKRYDEGIKILRDQLGRENPPGLDVAMLKTLMAKTYLEKGDVAGARQALGKALDSGMADAFITAARIDEAAANMANAREMYRQAVERYPTSEYVLASSAAFFWRQGEDHMAAALITKGRPSMGKFSYWYFNDFFKVFVAAPQERVERALAPLINMSMPPWEIESIAFGFKRAKRPELACWLFERSKPQHFMEQLERDVRLYATLKQWKGAEEAWRSLTQKVSAKARGPLAMMLLSEGLYEELLRETENLDSYPANEREFLRLARVMAWLAQEKRPAALAAAFERDYASASSDHYHTAGRYLLGKIGRDELLAAIKTPKQRCELSYYVGLAERLKGNFRNAAIWYQICRETMLQNNGEYHWATNELVWWFKLGLSNRHRLPSADVEAAIGRDTVEAGAS